MLLPEKKMSSPRPGSSLNGHGLSEIQMGLVHEAHLPAAHVGNSNSLSQLDEDTDLTFRAAYINAIKAQFFYLGLSSGASLQMFAVSVILMVASYSHDSGPIAELSHQYYAVFRCVFFISFFFSLYGANLFIWRRAKIDYAAVLGVSYAHTYQYVLRGSTSVAYIVFSCFMLYVLTLTGGLEAIHGERLKHLWPMLAVVLPLLIFLCPIDELTYMCYGVKRLGFSQRFNLFGQVLAVLCTPFSESTFLRSFIADIFCSMPKIFTDLQYTVCIYATGLWAASPTVSQELDIGHLHAYGTCGAGSRYYFGLQLLLAFLPYYLRLMQAFRAFVDTRQRKHLFNMLKYFASLVVTSLATARSLSKRGDPAQGAMLEFAWLVSGTLATLYSWYWDVFMDWGLGNWKCANLFLRDQLYFPPVHYYWAILLDGVMRLGWIIYISPGQVFVQQHVILLLGCVELVRRFMWAIFRVEWEHICRHTSSHSLKDTSSIQSALEVMYGHKKSGSSSKLLSKVEPLAEELGAEDMLRYLTSTTTTLKGDADDEEDGIEQVRSGNAADFSKYARDSGKTRKPNRTISEVVRQYE